MYVRGKDVKFSVLYKVVDIFHPDRKEKQRIDDVNYLLHDASLTLTMQVIEPVECELVAV